MITKIEETKNGYRFTKDATNEQLAAIFKARPNIKCIITNHDTRGFFRVGNGLMGSRANIFTVNNRVGDMEFYINTVR